MWAQKTIHHVLEIITNEERGSVAVQYWHSHKDSSFRAASSTWFGARLAKNGSHTRIPWQECAHVIGQEEALVHYVKKLASPIRSHPTGMV